MITKFDDLVELQNKYYKNFGHRLEIDISTDLGVWKVEFGMEGWSCLLADCVSENLNVAINVAIMKLNSEII